MFFDFFGLVPKFMGPYATRPRMLHIYA